MREEDLNTISIAMTKASNYVPGVVADKLQQIAEENDVRTFHLTSARELTPIGDQFFLLPRHSRVWLYDGGRLWLLFSDGDLLAEPLADNVDTSLQEQKKTVWEISLDDGAQHVRVSQYMFSFSEQTRANRPEPEKHNATQSSGAGAETNVTFTCARCGEMAGLQWVLANANQQEAEEKLRFLLGEGCDACQTQGGAVAPTYADRYLLRLIEAFLLTHLRASDERMALLLEVEDGIHALQRQILGLPSTWREDPDE